MKGRRESPPRCSSFCTVAVMVSICGKYGFRRCPRGWPAGARWCKSASRSGPDGLECPREGRGISRRFTTATKTASPPRSSATPHRPAWLLPSVAPDKCLYRIMSGRVAGEARKRPKKRRRLSALPRPWAANCLNAIVGQDTSLERPPQTTRRASRPWLGSTVRPVRRQHAARAEARRSLRCPDEERQRRTTRRLPGVRRLPPVRAGYSLLKRHQQSRQDAGAGEW